MPPPWKEQYASQVTSAAHALAPLKKGETLFTSAGAAEPSLLSRLLADLATEWDREALHVYALSPSLLPAHDQAAGFRRLVFSLLPGEGTLPASDYLPMPSWRIKELLGTQIPLDLALIQVSPPDEHGFCSLGPAVDIAKPAVDVAKRLVAEVNPYLPWTWGNSMIHVDQVDALVANEQRLPEFVSPEPDAIAQQIAGHVARLVPDQATLGLGIGPMMEAVLAGLSQRRNLGLHTDVFTEGMMALIESGVILNRAKTLYPDKVVATRCLGTSRLYEYIHDNPLLEFHPSHHVCAPEIVGQNARMTAINAALAVDLAGQACVTRISQGTWEESGANRGLAQGAAQAKGGRSIIALRSTDAQGRSRIGMALPPGCVNAIQGSDVHFVVTEHGIAELGGRTLEERAMELINVAHPDLRQGLFQQAQEQGYLLEKHLAPAGAYPHEVETTVTLASGLDMRVRPIKPSDDRLIREMFYALSDQTLYFRFFRVPKSVPAELVRRGERIDYDREMTLVGLITHEGRERAIAVSRYVVDDETRMADVALVVQDDYQRQGIGSWMLMYLGHVAQQRGLRGLKADILVGNYRGLGLVNKQNMGIKATLRNGYYSVSYEFPEAA